MSDSKKLIGTVNITPTWGGLVYHMMLVLQTSEDANNIQIIQEEFKSMARAADKWNEHCRTDESP